MSATILTRDPEAFARKAPHLAARSDLTFHAGDVRDFSLSGKFDYIIHAATQASAKLNEQDPQEMLDTIITGTKHVLSFAEVCGVKKFLLTSSGAVYGKQPHDLTHVGEDYIGAPDPLQPGSAYGEGKRVAEHMCATHAKQAGYESKIARCFGFVGPHLPLDTHFAIGNFIHDAKCGGPIRINGDGTPMRSFLYASDLAVWLWTVLFCAPSTVAYNVGSSHDLSISELASVVKEQLSPSSPILTARQPNHDTPVLRYVPCTKRAAKELNLVERVDLERSLQKTLDWLTLQP
jgi:dTDP-glucose 4,6-dehydratase